MSERISRSSNIYARKKTILPKTTNRKDFDYLGLRKQENVRLYRPASAILESQSESNQVAVFSEIVQVYDTNLTPTEMVILITRRSIYLLDSRCNIKSRIDISSLCEFILVKASPSFFAMYFLYS